MQCQGVLNRHGLVAVQYADGHTEQRTSYTLTCTVHSITANQTNTYSTCLDSFMVYDILLGACDS